MNKIAIKFWYSSYLNLVNITIVIAVKIIPMSDIMMRTIAAGWL